MKCSLGISNFLEEISSLSHSVQGMVAVWSQKGLEELSQVEGQEGQQ